ncbi:hypothetical protein DFR68_10197 [Nocardia mexicana]|uniref:Uncharacterized protein n=1 Tax=Nocardia mexicana TaxID=279262 RepID=A0A370HDF2_9NOCA|nr:hypothetical protein DFR68_10197 [Nocardia mexicana]
MLGFVDNSSDSPAFIDVDGAEMLGVRRFRYLQLAHGGVLEETANRPDRGVLEKVVSPEGCDVVLLDDVGASLQPVGSSGWIRLHDDVGDASPFGSVEHTPELVGILRTHNRCRRGDPAPIQQFQSVDGHRSTTHWQQVFTNITDRA